MRYVRGVQHYQHARDVHGDDRPSVDEGLADLYERAVRELDAAVAEPDARGYPKAAAGCRWLIAWCRYVQSSVLAAPGAFARAAALDPTRHHDHYEAALAHHAAGDATAAIAQIVRAIAVAPHVALYGYSLDDFREAAAGADSPSSSSLEPR